MKSTFTVSCVGNLLCKTCGQLVRNKAQEEIRVALMRLLIRVFVYVISRRKSGGRILKEFLRKRWHAVCGGVKRWLLTKASVQSSTRLVQPPVGIHHSAIAHREVYFGPVKKLLRSDREVTVAAHLDDVYPCKPM